MIGTINRRCGPGCRQGVWGGYNGHMPTHTAPLFTTVTETPEDQGFIVTIREDTGYSTFRVAEAVVWIGTDMLLTYVGGSNTYDNGMTLTSDSESSNHRRGWMDCGPAALIQGF